MTTQTTDHPFGSITEELRAQADVRLAAQVFLDHTPLPAPTLLARPTVLHVLLADTDDLGPWLEQRGGEIHISAPFEGVELWTLHTTIPDLSEGDTVPVRVSVPVPDRIEVMGDIRSAVTR